MTTPLEDKSTVAEIRQRFDHDVERFSNLESGQTATIDAPLAMELITQAAVAARSPIDRVLDIGCGAGNNTLRLRQVCESDFDVDLVDLSQPMLDRASSRIKEINGGNVRALAADFRDVDLAEQSYDVVVAAAVLHHLRDDADWEAAFQKVYRLLKPGGSFWVTDLVSHESVAIQELMWQRYGDYLTQLNGKDYRDTVFAYIDREDSPRPVTWQLDLLRRVGFESVDLLHKNACFAAFGGVRGRR
ncbi:MAG: class I SAM-dependent methyltransferase [Planctomycetaceae bacterium]|nr:class I SAM-dependent methyltransferase [Planctomycetaceae bacterium]